MRYVCAPCNKKAVVNAYSFMFIGIVLVPFGLFLLYVDHDYFLMVSSVIIMELCGITFLILGISTVKMCRKGMSIPEEDFHEETVGRIDVKKVTYFSHPYNKKE